MTTIREVAKLAGVAPITVSRVLNDSGYVSEEKRARVRAAVAELGYVPNSLARSFRSRRTDTMALILTDITNPFWTTVARGVEDVASTAGFTVIFCNTDESVVEQARYVDLVLQKQVDGILLAPAGNAPQQVAAIRSQQVPLVILDRRIAGAQADTVTCDSVGGAFALAQLLIGLGHRRIALLNGPRAVTTAEDRLRGYRQGLAEAGIPFDDGLTFWGGFDLESGYAMAQQALALAPSPTALVAANNFIAIGAVRAVRDAGLRIPEDIALVGFDDLPTDLVIDPFLTAAAQPAYSMGQQATALLLARIAGTGPPDPKEIVLPIELIVRRSSGPPLLRRRQTMPE